MDCETMTVKEVARYLGVHSDLVYGLVRQKDIPHMRLGSRILFTKDSIQKWILKLQIEGLDSECDSK